MVCQFNMMHERNVRVALLVAVLSCLSVHLAHAQRCTPPIARNELPRTRPPSWAPYLTVNDVAAPTIKNLTGNGAALFNITFAPLQGVSSQMLAWWYQNMVGSSTINGTTWRNWLLYHPRDMVSIALTKNGTNCTYGVGARYNAKEFVISPEPGFTQLSRGMGWTTTTQADYEFEVTSVGPDHITISYVLAGLGTRLSFMELTYSWTDNGDAANPVAFVTKSQRIGLLSNTQLTNLINSAIPNQFGCRQTLNTLVDRTILLSIQAIGNLARFLPTIYAARTPASEPCFPTA